MLDYSAFESAVNNEKIYLESGLSFKDICRKIKVRPARVEKALRSELGCGGELLLKKFREDKSWL